MADLRSDPRTQLAVEVEVTMPDGDIGICKTRDISHSGMFIILPEGNLPEVGAKLYVRINGHLADGEEPPLNRVEVMRTADDGVGVRFL